MLASALDALKKQHPDAERQLSGYKQLQMHIRKGLRDLKEILLLAPPEVKPPLELVQQDLASMDDELLRMLFPPRPGRKNPEPASGSSTGGPPPAPGDSAPDPPTAKTPEKSEDKTEDKPGSKPETPPRRLQPKIARRKPK